jgi:hypothetical protein
MLPWFQQSRSAPAATEAHTTIEPLRSVDSIRLLKLKPGKGLQEFEFELEIGRINLLPKYEVLSYSMYLVTIPFQLDILHPSICSSRLAPIVTGWGDRTKSTMIQCNGKRLAISANLGVAVRRFRQKFRTRTM